MNNLTSALILAAGLHLLSFLDLLYRFKRRKDSLIAGEIIERNRIHRCTFINGQVSKDCETHLAQKKPCYRSDCTYKNMRRLLDGLGCCRKTLDVCINLLCCQDVAECILEVALIQNVKVRIICDSVMAKNLGSQIPMLVKAGIDVRSPVNITMHSKFAIMDSKTLLIGSMNWTVQGLHGNWDAFILTSQPDIVTDYIRNFTQMFYHTKTISFS